MKNRLYRFDNIKFLLMLLVILGHFIEITFPVKVADESQTGFEIFYRIIYTFHMPAFIFVSGYFAKFTKKRFLRLSLIYLIFQTIYLVANSAFFNTSEDLNIQFTTPYWLLWYILALIVYSLIIPLITTDKRSLRITVFVLSIVFPLLSGFCKDIGMYLSLSRIISFLPYFIAGYYMKHYIKPARIHPMIKLRVFLCALVLCVSGSVLIANTPSVTRNVLYQSVGYLYGHYNIGIKLLLLIIAFSYISVLYLLPGLDHRIPIISTLGKNTMPVFLLHGFIVRGLRQTDIPLSLTQYGMAFPIIATLAVYLLLGNTYVARLFDYISSFGLSGQNRKNESAVEIRQDITEKENTYTKV